MIYIHCGIVKYILQSFIGILLKRSTFCKKKKKKKGKKKIACVTEKSNKKLLKRDKNVKTEFMAYFRER